MVSSMSVKMTYEVRAIPGVGEVGATVRTKLKADGTPYVRFLDNPRTLDDDRPVSNEALDAVREAFNAN